MEKKLYIEYKIVPKHSFMVESHFNFLCINHVPFGRIKRQKY